MFAELREARRYLRKNDALHSTVGETVFDEFFNYYWGVTWKVWRNPHFRYEVRSCAACGRPRPMRSGQKYCSPKCRVKAHRLRDSR